MSSQNPISDINSGRPFIGTAKKYRKHGFHPFPLPEGKKFPPPTGFTGKDAPEVTYSQIEDWSAELQSPAGLGDRKIGTKANVGLHLFTVEGEDGEPILLKNHLGEEMPAEIVGLDVDNYGDKKGGETLESLEKKLGPLPETWISSARDDGISGIRYFLAPSGYSYRGQAGKSIDVIYRGYRFAVVWPSYHPTAGQYQWFAPGCAPTGQGGSVFAAQGAGASMSTLIPKAWELPELPSAWLEHLTQRYTEYTSESIDMDMPEGKLDGWLGSVAKGDPGKKPPKLSDLKEELEDVGCKHVKKRVEAMSKIIKESDDSHPVLTGFHWEFARIATEGHRGWATGLKLLNIRWRRHVLGGDDPEDPGAQKRNQDEVIQEVRRSWTGAIRKLIPEVVGEASGEVDDEGEPILLSPRRMSIPRCNCFDEPVASSDDGSDEFAAVRSAGAKDPGEYEQNDDGNAEHLADLFPDSLKWVKGYESWIFWDGKRWQWDNGHARRAFRQVKKRQVTYAENLFLTAQIAKASDNPEAKELESRAKAWARWSKNSGNNAAANNAVEAMKSFHDIALESDEIDHNPWIMGVENGVLEFTSEGVVLREERREDFLTSRSPHSYIPLDEQIKRGGELYEGVALWLQALERVQPKEENLAWLQQAMGMCMPGFNVQKKMIFLYGGKNTGKSTFLNTLINAYGPQYAGSLSMNVFDDRTLNPQLANALMKRIVVIPEAAGKQNAQEELLKRISGNDVINAEYKNANDSVERVASFTMLFSANDSPNFGSYGDALRDRIMVIPFDTEQVKSDRGDEIERKCAVAALAWLVEGWRMYCVHKLGNEPDNIGKVRREFDERATPVGMFVTECLETTNDSSDFVPVDRMYDAYNRWCERTNEKPWTKRQFSNQMVNAGFKPKVVRPKGADKTVRSYVGVALQGSGDRKFRPNVKEEGK